MAAIDEILIPSLTLEEVASDGSTLTNPAADHRRLFLGEDGLLHLRDSAGTVTTPSSGLSDPMTTRGDIIIRNASNVTARLGRGSAGQVLTSDGTDIAWGTPSAGSSRPYLDTYSNPLDGTYGDDFDGSSLNARWTRRTITSGMETYQASDGSHILATITSATQDAMYTQGISAGDFDFICSMSFWASTGSAPMYGLFAITSTGAGRGPLLYTQDNGAYHGVLTAYQYVSNSGLITAGTAPSVMRKVWYRLTRVSTTITAYISFDGINWGHGVAATDSASFDRVAVGRCLGAGTADRLYIDRFDRVA